ncbi:MAG: leucine-rich repeat protein [Muribaculaceae bacterium]|nr:leucine-rich repeat protein [Muribaculaceae bacterium]
MKHLLRFSVMLLALLLPLTATAADFMVDDICYNIHGNEAAVASRRVPGFLFIGYSGAVVIPATVTYNETTYPVTSIEDIAFYGCHDLTSIVVPNSVTEIGQEAFGNCPGLTSIVVESGNPRFDSRNNCNAIIEITDNELIAGCKNTIIPNSVTKIGNFAFGACVSLTSIVIPNSVTEIGHYAFHSCDSLTSIDIPNSVIEIGYGVFESCLGLTSIVVGSGNPRYDSRNNCNAIIETAYNTLLYGCKNTTIPYSVTTIDDYAFYGCDSLTSIVIPNSVTEIGYGAFYDCIDLTSIVIPNSVTSIGDVAFCNCWRLTDVYCYIADLSNVSSGNRAFYSNSYGYSGRTLHVLQGTADAYRADENWYPYFGQIVEDIFMGDVNGDLEVNIADVNVAIDMILGGNSSTPAADVNADGEINIADINAIIDIILGGTRN